MRLVVIMCAFAWSVAFGWGESLKSIEADFTQSIVSEDGIPARYEGHIYGKAPARVKWLYKAPLEKEIYMDGSEVMIYEPSLKQVSHSRLREKSDFISIIRGAQKQSDGTYHAKVEGVEYVMYVDSKNLPARIEYTDNMGAKTTLTLHNVKLNGKMSDRLFHFTPPSDVEVVELKSR